MSKICTCNELDVRKGVNVLPTSCPLHPAPNPFVNDTITKEQYLEQLVFNVASIIAEQTTPNTKELMVPHWQDIIFNGVKPILKLIG